MYACSYKKYLIIFLFLNTQLFVYSSFKNTLIVIIHLYLFLNHKLLFKYVKLQEGLLMKEFAFEDK